MRRILRICIDFLLPPRATEARMRSMTLRDLQELSYGSETGALPYDRPEVKALVWELKYHADQRAAQIAGAYISEILLAAAAEEIGKPLLIPIPMHPVRRKERGHNQTETLCEAALKHLENTYEYVPSALRRIHHTKPQQGLPQHIRLNNVKGSMSAEGSDAGRIAGRVCVVVDDVNTTGATFEEARRALRSAGARAVHCIALAKS